MNSPEYRFMPYSLRWFIAITALVIAWLIWLLIFNGAGVPTTATVTVGVCVLVLAFLSIGVLRTERSPLLPLWMCVAIIIVRSAMIMISLIGRPAGLTPTILTAVIVLAIAAGMLVRHRPRIAIALFVVLALLGMYGLALVPFAVWRYGGAPMRNVGAPGAIVGAACVAAAWHALRARPGHPLPSSSPAAL